MMSPLSFLVMLLIMIIIPTILYSFFFLINCPPTPFQLRCRRSSETGDEGSKKGEKKEKETKNGDIELVVTVSSELGKDAECPVCLSAFVEGEELKQLKICKHVFHKSCIDKWLSSHYNCPLCRAFVSSCFKAKEKRDAHRLLGRDVVGVGGRDDHWQGLPDSAGLI